MRRDFESKKTRNDEGLARGQFEELVAFFGSKDRAGFTPFLSGRTIRAAPTAIDLLFQFFERQFALVGDWLGPF